MQTIKNQIPNLLTLGNLFCGCLAIKFAFEWDLVMAAYLVGIAALFDFLDGFAARLLKVSGEMGKQLDSLADMVSFGVVPGVVMFQMMRIISNNSMNHNESIEFVSHDTYLIIENGTDNINLLCYIAFLIPLFSAYRLAKFNIDTRQTDKFIGLPTPANSIFILSIPLILNWTKEILLFGNINSNPGDWMISTVSDNYLFVNFPLAESFMTITILVIVTVIFSILLIAELPLFALKFKNFGWVDNKIRYIFLIISLAMLIIFQLVAIPFIVILYILLSILNNLIFKQ